MSLYFLILDGDFVCSLRRLLWVSVDVVEGTKYALLAFRCSGLCAGKGGKKQTKKKPKH